MSEELKDEALVEGIDPVFHEIVRKYGRSMFALVMNAGMAQQAAVVLSQAAAKHRSQHAAHAIAIMSQAFNQVSNSYVVLMGWDEGTLAQCDRDIQYAFAGKIRVPGQSVIQLDS